MKKWLLFASALCLVAVLAACGAKSDNQESNNAGNGEAVAADSGATGEAVVITASNWEFDQKEYKIKAGEATNITLKSTDGVHGVKIDKVDNIANGQTKTVTVAEPGTYEMICSVPCGNGHRQMKATLVVE
ncbi:cupredoxin domain-containing protein [Paenibacillus harenae]|uniref:cupredoxin domain-containing protein n=1 Tax=Paenibacillus harenae TaxID=306543 RepID=UPI00278FCEEF|nr:cupredoxin domain-containing protein [Paenibacillus harenae]MDQ0061143.1 cytochrome c oxidase subunit 2 [Paenibacillus harenae]